MFGLMTVARHHELCNEAMVAERESANRLYEANERLYMARITELAESREHWRTLAARLADDMADLMRRQAPPLPGPEESEMGTIADDEHTPSAIAKREKAVGARR